MQRQHVLDVAAEIAATVELVDARRLAHQGCQTDGGVRRCSPVAVAGCTRRLRSAERVAKRRAKEALRATKVCFSDGADCFSPQAFVVADRSGPERPRVARGIPSGQGWAMGPVGRGQGEPRGSLEGRRSVCNEFVPFCNEFRYMARKPPGPLVAPVWSPMPTHTTLVWPDHHPCTAVVFFKGLSSSFDFVQC